MSDTEKIEWQHCNECGRDTNHLIIHNYRNKEFDEEIKDNFGNVFTSIDGYHDWELFECQGCKTVFLRSKQYCSEWWSGLPNEDPCEYTHFPKRNKGTRIKPHWFEVFSNLNNLQGHFILISYTQIYELIESRHYLAAMLTARALLETIAIEKGGGGDKRTFKEKLENLYEKDYIRKSQINPLNDTIYDSGSAAMHRSYNPNEIAITHVLDAIEALIYTIYIEPIALAELEEEKPEDSRKKKSQK